MTHAGWQPKPHSRPRPKIKRLGPGLGTLLARGVTKRCPACGQRNLFERWFTIAERCPRCGLKFERIEGHWIGAIGLNTILTFGFLAIMLVLALLAFWGSDVPRWTIAAGGALLALLVPPIIDPFTRTTWTAIDIAMRPLEAHEVDWMVVSPGAIVPAKPVADDSGDDAGERSTGRP